MVEVDPSTKLIGANGPVTLLDSFEGRAQLIAYFFMWHKDHPAQDQCQGCTWVTAHMGELSHFHARDVTFAVFAQGPYEESAQEIVELRSAEFAGHDAKAWFCLSRHRRALAQLSTQHD
jgi:predicted dithiol-disulfide oxidoreductase (DUF899 family)